MAAVVGAVVHAVHAALVHAALVHAALVRAALAKSPEKEKGYPIKVAFFLA